MDSNTLGELYSGTSRIRAGAVRALSSVRPKYYVVLANVFILVLAADGLGMPGPILAMLMALLALCFVGHRFALRVYPEVPRVRQGPGRAVLTALLKTLKALLLLPLIGIALFVALVWAHGPSSEERGLAQTLRAQVARGQTKIPLAQVLRESEGTVCMAMGGDWGLKRFASVPWAQDALSTNQSLLGMRSMFAPDDYRVFLLALRTPDGAVRRWELNNSDIGAFASQAEGSGPSQDPAIVLSRPCVPLRSAVLLRVPLQGRSGYVLADSATAAL